MTDKRELIKLGLPPRWWRARSAEEIISDSSGFPEENQRLCTGSCVIDKVFNGGIPRRILFEITGEAGTGKTQWCFSLMASVLLSNISFDDLNKDLSDIGFSCIIYTENGVFPRERLFEILYHRIEFEINKNAHNFKREYDNGHGDFINIIANKLINYVKVYKIDNIKDLELFIQKDIPYICLNYKIDAIFIDSITNLYRSKVSFSNSRSVSTGLLQISNVFKKIAFDNNCWFVVTNQTTTDINNKALVNSNSNNKKPCLGLLWSNTVNWRVFLSKKTHNNKRELSVYLSSEIAKIK
ncbi:hypothetical protein FG386_002426 [Cryptosporidium ryanae]|uniref:uncharacterized protein n=1 Tax=Cryptosporidium ryanae TaxID=515981 RepID=UPI003519E722|nr:hypothetical protein FG386_002426 [Cryptosporidium ryanae]